MRNSSSFYSPINREPVSRLAVFTDSAADSAALSWEPQASSACIKVSPYLFAHLHRFLCFLSFMGIRKPKAVKFKSRSRRLDHLNV